MEASSNKTELKTYSEAEFKKKVEEIENYYKNIIHSMPNNVYWLDKNCITQGCNENVLKIIGLKSYDEFVGITYEKMSQLAGWTEGQGDSFKHDDLDVMNTGIAKMNVEEPPVYTRDGKLRYYMSSRVPIFNEKHNVVGVVGISVDITERKNMEEQLKLEKEKAEAANEAKSAFLATMSHELRTPLNGILGMAQVLKSKTNQSDLNEYIDIIDRSGKNLLALVNDILDLSMIESGNITLKNTEFSFETLLDDIMISCKPLVANKPVELLSHCEENLPKFVIGDELRIRQVLLNLIGNAAKFTSEGNISIFVRAKYLAKNKVRIYFTVNDTGIGIPDDKLSAIFERFTQVESSYDRRYEGAGLGLAIVQKLIKLMGGNITVESQIGVGSEFKANIVLELAQNNLEVIETCPTTELKRNKLNVLLVEDNVVNQQVAEEFLLEAGATVDIAGTGQDAMRLYCKNNYDIVFMDLSLPDADGLAISQEFAKLKYNKGVPIIALTAHVLEEDQKKCKAAGMQAILTKPLVKTELFDVLSEWTDKSD